jgi:flagellar hook assembly protein FlgD
MKYHTRFRTFVLFAFMLALVVSCATFKGEIPVELEIPDTVYISPKNGDGIQDELSIPLLFPEVKNLVIQGYRFTVFDWEENPVYSVQEEAEGNRARKGVQIPEALTWKGVDGAGEFVGDGEYSYVIEAWDRRDNTGKTVPRYVVVDNTPPFLELFVSFPVFTPNGDGIADTITIRQRSSSVEELWTGSIQDSAAVSREFEWRGLAPDFAWDGKDADGNPAADGEYSYRVASTDQAGNSASFTLAGITVDRQPRPVSLNVDMPSFSPNGDGKKETLRFLPGVQVTRNAERWQLRVYDERGLLRRNYQGTGAAGGSISFDGRDARGAVLPDGMYRGVLKVFYATGEQPEATSSAFQLDTTKPQATLSADFQVFSPDGDGNKDSITISQSSSVEELWQGAVIDPAGQAVKTYTWTGRAVQFSWNGEDRAGKTVPDGVYVYRLSATDGADNTGVVDVKNIRIDTRPTPVSIRTEASAFSPNGDGFFDSLGFTISAGLPDGLQSWSLQILDGGRKVIRTLQGGDLTGRVPASITWDGRDEEAKVVEGSFTAAFTAEYVKGNVATANSEAFRLDVAGPSVRLDIKPQPFSPDGDGSDDTVSITAATEDPSPVGEWSARILDPAGNLFKAFSGSGPLRAPLVWDGKSDSGELVQSASDYALVFTVRDGLHNETRAETLIPVDILVIRDGDKLKISISSIYFKAFTADYMSLEANQVQRNLKTLDRLAEILKKYGGYKIQVEGHAVRIYWFDPQKLKEEEEGVLLPLSKDRAEVIKQALVKRGIAENRMVTAGFGGSRPVVPHSDLANRWKNRRVEFVLIKE